MESAASPEGNDGVGAVSASTSSAEGNDGVGAVSASTSSAEGNDGTGYPNQAITKYIALAKKKQKERQMKIPRGRKCKQTRSDLCYEDQIMIPIGRMYHCHRRNKGILDKQYVTQSVVFRQNMTYPRVLEKCVSAVFPDDDESDRDSCFYYVATGRGIPISSEEFIRVENDDGIEECIPWTLQTYIKLSSIKYASKARFYCVKKYVIEETSVPSERDQETVANQETQLPEALGLEKSSEVLGDEQLLEGQRRGPFLVSPAETLGDQPLEVTGHEAKGPLEVLPDHEGQEEQLLHVTMCNEDHPLQTSVVVPDIAQESEVSTRQPFETLGGGKVPNKPSCEPLFAHFRESRYEQKFVMVSNLTQKRVLQDKLDFDEDRMHEVDDILESNPNRPVLFPDNPCKLGFWLTGIQNVVDLAENYDMEKGEVIYSSPVDGSQLCLWTGVNVSQEDFVALLMCVALNSYHSVVTYEWNKDGYVLADEVYPLLYVTSVGKYVCSVTIVSKNKTVQRHFEVKGTSRADFSACESETTVDLNTEYLQIYQDILPCDCEDISQIKLVNVIGQGSFGTVHKAVWRGCLVAAKVIQLAENSNQKIIGEVQKCRKLQHPNIIQILGSEQRPGQLMIMMTLVNGPNLHDVIFSGKHPTLNLTIKFHIGIQLCQALTFMHSSSPPVAHLDIKPSNILIEKETWKVFVGDFGLCQVMSGTTIIGTKTMLAGSPGFQSPEQLRNESVGSPNDVYALGTVFLVLFGETQVWPGLSHYQIMFKVAVCNESPNTEHLPIPLKDVCCLCFNEVQLRPPANIVLQHLISIIHDY